jgi:hypothetical protein
LYLLLQRDVHVVEGGVICVVIVLACSSQLSFPNKQSELILDLQAFSPFSKNNLLGFSEAQPINHVTWDSDQQDVYIGARANFTYLWTRSLVRRRLMTSSPQ